MVATMALVFGSIRVTLPLGLWTQTAVSSAAMSYAWSCDTTPTEEIRALTRPTLDAGELDVAEPQDVIVSRQSAAAPNTSRNRFTGASSFGHQRPKKGAA